MAVPVTPADWLPILASKLDAEMAGSDTRLGITQLREYANGKAPVPEGRKNLRESWESFQKKARTNYGGLAVETVASRIVPLVVVALRSIATRRAGLVIGGLRRGHRGLDFLKSYLNVWSRAAVGCALMGSVRFAPMACRRRLLTLQLGQSFGKSSLVLGMVTGSCSVVALGRMT